MMNETMKHEARRQYAKMDISRSIVHHPQADGQTTLDRRTRKTKNALRAATFALIVEKGYDEVTVQDIIERADVGRSTFYTHFTDKHDAFRSGFDAICNLLQKRMKNRDKTGLPFSFGMEIYRHFHEPQMRALYRAIKDHASGAISKQWLTNLVTQLVRLDLAKLPSLPQDVREDALEAFIVSGYLGLLTWSLEMSNPPDSEHFDDIFRTLVSPVLHS